MSQGYPLLGTKLRLSLPCYPPWLRCCKAQPGQPPARALDFGLLLPPRESISKPLWVRCAPAPPHLLEQNLPNSIPECAERRTERAGRAGGQFSIRNQLPTQVEVGWHQRGSGLQRGGWSKVGLGHQLSQEWSQRTSVVDCDISWTSVSRDLLCRTQRSP